MKETLIDLKNISFSKKNNHILKNINLRIIKGDKIALLGKSGSGKTTLISILNGTLNCTTGNYKIQNRKFVDSTKRKKINIGTIWQDLRLIEDLSAEQNVNSGLLEKKSLIFAFKNLLNLCSFKEAHKCMKICNLNKSIFAKNIKVLSGGEKQRIAIARTIIQKPNIIFADEPFNNLDSNTISKLKDILLNKKLIYEYKIPETILISLHRLELLKGFNRVLGMNEGKIMFDLKIEDFNNHHLEKIY